MSEKSTSSTRTKLSLRKRIAAWLLNEASDVANNAGQSKPQKDIDWSEYKELSRPFNSLHGQVNFPGIVSRFTFDNFNKSVKGVDSAYSKARELLKAHSGGLLLLGNHGCGKTHLAAAIFNEYYEDTNVKTAIYFSTPDLLDFLRNGIGSDADKVDGYSDLYYERLKAVCHTPLLVLDDFGSENHTPWSDEKLFQIVNFRYLCQATTVIATSVDPENMNPLISSRLLDREVFRFGLITADNYRIHNPEDRKRMLKASKAKSADNKETR